MRGRLPSTPQVAIRLHRLPSPNRKRLTLLLKPVLLRTESLEKSWRKVVLNPRPL